jgi:hypothetical protein
MSDKACMNREIDEAMDESFPASDPPSYIGSVAVSGGPAGKRTAAPERAARTENPCPAGERTRLTRPLHSYSI